MSRVVLANRLPPHFASSDELRSAWVDTDDFLAELPTTFSTTPRSFYATLGQRNLSGFVGEVFKSALHHHTRWLQPNPHPDGRPDLLDLGSAAALEHYINECHDSRSHLPVKSLLTPFRFGGFEVKCAVGSVRSAAEFPICRSRVHAVTGITYWAHHKHACKLIGLYYDFVEEANGCPEIKAIFMADISIDHWAEVSTGRPDRKKTSNTSILKPGMDLVKQGLVGYDPSEDYVVMLRRIGVPI